jgi:hypothetical protein
MGRLSDIDDDAGVGAHVNFGAPGRGADLLQRDPVTDELRKP